MKNRTTKTRKEQRLYGKAHAFHAIVMHVVNQGKPEWTLKVFGLWRKHRLVSNSSARCYIKGIAEQLLEDDYCREANIIFFAERGFDLHVLAKLE